MIAGYPAKGGPLLILNSGTDEDTIFPGIIRLYQVAGAASNNNKE